MTTVLYRGGRVHSPVSPDAQAMLVDGDTVAWVGSDAAADAMSGHGSVDLGGALVTPAFVDAHVHCLDTGLHLLGVDLTTAGSIIEVLDLVAAAAAARPGATVLGHGWDEASLAEGRPPSADDLQRAAPGARVYLSRVDVHSAVVSWALAEGASLSGRHGWHGDGLVSGDAHHAARAASRTLSPASRREAHEMALRAAAAAGIGYLHEMSGPDLVGPDDLAPLLDAATAVGMKVTPYWGQLAGVDVSAALDASGAGASVAGLAGDLCVDGSFGSRTAALREPYADDPGCGRLYLSAQQVGEHVAACGRAGVPAGFHVIGDAGLDTIIEGLERVRAEAGAATVRRARVRLEHVEACDDDQLAALVRHGVGASVQPAFDAAWGGPQGMYARRLGERAAALNRFAAMASAGLPLAFGSDSPVTPFDPWGAIAAATGHHEPAQRISARAAFAAHTRGAHRMAREDPTGTAGVLTPGAPASFAVWQAGELVVWAPDERLQAWSTDPRSGTAALPDVSTGGPRPRCLRTVVAGIVAFDSGHLP